MKKVSLLLAFLCLVGLQLGFSQTREITGKVTSSEDGGGIPGASIVVKGTTVGTIADMDGQFRLKEQTEIIFSTFIRSNNKVNIKKKIIL